ncbi:hypothetical protein [Citrobacter koseri]|uniref:hypothetical protein n=1 Tax=Citrobacter koseri TaxID=545 RepID=UPI00389139D6
MENNLEPEDGANESSDGLTYDNSRHEEILKGLADIEAGRFISNEEMKDFVKKLQTK